MKHIFTALFCILILFSAQSQDSLLSYSDGQKWGVTNQELEVLIMPQFDTALLFNDHHLSVAKLQNKYGVINLKGEVTIPFIYEHIYDFDDTCGTGILDGKNILLNFKTGKRLSEQAYDKAWSHADLFINVVLNNKQLILSKVTGKPINTVAYDEVEFLRFSNQIAKVKIGDKYGIIDPIKNTLLLAIRYDMIDENYSNDQLEATEGPILKVFDNKGKLIRKTVMKKEEKERIIQNTQMVVAPPQENEEEKEGVGMYVSDLGNGNWGLSLEDWKKGKKEVLSYKAVSGYSKVEKLVCFTWSQTATLTAIKNGKVGLIDHNGIELLPATYEEISYSDRYYFIKKDGKTGVLNADLKTVVPPILGRIVHYYWGHLFLVEMPDGRKGFMNGDTGKIYIPNL